MAVKRQAVSRRDGNGRGGAYDGVRRLQLSDLQRARMVTAMLEVACERGVANVSVAHVTERSGVSRRTFYEAFSDREECFIAAFEQALSTVAERVLPAYEAGTGWSERIRAGLIALLVFLDEQPNAGRVLISESLSGGPRVLERRGQVVRRLTHVVNEGRGEAKDATLPSDLLGEAIVGGVLSVLHTRLTQDEREATVPLTNSLMSMIVAPYLGASAARRELTRKLVAPQPVVSTHSSSVDPFKEAGMRLTYRTVRVVMAIADHPGSSNRQIGETAGMTDQGQISKLLSRLERIGLIHNAGQGPGTGSPNAWTLNEQGHKIVHTIRGHTDGSDLGSSEPA